MAETAKKWPSSPKKLLEARYKAFEKGDIDFILESHHPETRETVDKDAVKSWSSHSKWMGLTVEEEKVEGDKAHITFTVVYEKNHETTNHKECAEFRKEDGKWFYYDSEFPSPETVRRESQKVGRNDPCHCGSGKKFKKCHGALKQSA